MQIATPEDEPARDHHEPVFDEQGSPSSLGTAGLPRQDPPPTLVEEHHADGEVWTDQATTRPVGNVLANVQLVPEPPQPAAVATQAPAAAPAQGLAKRELSATAITKSGLLSSEDPLVLQEWGVMVVESNMFPNLHTWQAAVACGKMCQDLRLSPWISMGQFHIIEGKPTLSLPLILQLVKRHGVKYQFTQDYGYFAHPVSGDGDYLTEITFEHPSLIGGRVSYQIWFSECVQAGWTGKLNWRNMPRTMLRARVITTACRLYFPDLLGGSYEFGEMVDAGKVEDHTYAVEI
jgi:hypothetical protein